MTKAHLVTVGSIAPEFSLPAGGPVADAEAPDEPIQDVPTVHNAPVALAERRKQGHVVLYFMRAFH